MTETTEDTRPHRSVSQYNQFYRCSWAYKLARIDKKWQRPAAWLPQGSAVHEAVEAYEKSGRTMTLEQAQQVYDESYSAHVTRYAEETPNFDYWSRSGPYAGEDDINRRFEIGREQVAKYIRWATSTDDRVVWIAPDGTPGIELGFDIDLDGVLVRGFIDQVSVVGDDVEVVDVKTGATPGDDFQLGVYSVALAETYGIEPPRLGAYWMGKSGKLTYPYEIGEWTRERVSAAFRRLEDDIQAERFEPKPDPKVCLFCSVATSCAYRAT